LKEDIVNPYSIRQLDAEGQTLSEKQVVAPSYNGALRELKEIVDQATRIKVYNSEGEKAGEMSVDYWRLKGRGR
jgi:hypothetical protein